MELTTRPLIDLLMLASLNMAGCAALLPPIRQGTATEFSTGDVEVVVKEGQLPDLGRFTFTQGWSL